MEIRIPYEVVKEAVDKAADPNVPGTAIVFELWVDIDYPTGVLEIAIERPKEWLTIRTKDGKIRPFKLTRLQRLLWNRFQPWPPGTRLIYAQTPDGNYRWVPK